MQPILKIDLTTGRSEEFIIPIDWEKEYLGGASLAARILFESLTRELDPLSPGAPILILNGPLSGTVGPSVGRFVVCGKSPATGLWAESNIGGFWGPELRFCGYDGLWITGKAETPVYLWLQEGNLKIRNARDIWGKDTYESQTWIKREINIPGTRVLTIGPAGENGILFASLFCDHGRAGGRTGLGAVMGAKNLKAIAVQGKKKIPIFDPEKYDSVRSLSNRELVADNVSRVFHEVGTAGVVDYMDYLGSMPKKYYRKGTLEGVDKVSGSTMAETILVGTSACHGCVIACGRVVKLSDGEKRKGPEYESIVSFGPNLMITDLAVITHLTELCDRYGMDTISAGSTFGLVFHLFEKGIITTKDTNGLELRWGDQEVVEKLIHWTVRREGIGESIARGSRYLETKYGLEGEAIQVNGLELAYHDPRGFSGMSLVYATSPRGACHNQSPYYMIEFGQADPTLGMQHFDRHAGAEKAGNVARHQDWSTIFNALVMCIFANVPGETVVNLINAACGLEWNIADLFIAGERAWNLKRVINNRLGVTNRNDKLPKALFEPYKEGGAAGYIPPFEEMISAYYTARGWDPETGKPTLDKLRELNLEFVQKDIGNS